MARYGSMQYVSPGQWGLVDKIQDENLKRKEADPKEILGGLFVLL